MMAVIETWYNQDLQQPVKVHHLDGSMFSHNGNGNRIGVHVFNNGEPVTLSGTVSGYVITSDGSTVPCVGAMSGNEATITIPPAAYQPGSAFITIFLTEGSTATTICAAQTTVLQARTGSQVSPGSVVTDWTQTINAAMQSVEDAAENIGGIIATPYPSLTYPVPLGKYTYYNNNLYRCISPIAESEEFTAAHWKQVRLGDDVAELNSAIGLSEDKLFFESALSSNAQPEGWRLVELSGLCESNSSYKLVKYPVVSGTLLKVISDDMWQFQTVASVPSSGTSNRVGNTYKDGTFFVTVPETATYIIISTPKVGSAVAVYAAISEVEKIGNRISYAEIENGKKMYPGILTVGYAGTDGTTRTDYFRGAFTDIIAYENIYDVVADSAYGVRYALYDENDTFVEMRYASIKNSQFVKARAFIYPTRTGGNSNATPAEIENIITKSVILSRTNLPTAYVTSSQLAGKIDKNGEDQVTPANINGNGYNATEITETITENNYWYATGSDTIASGGTKTGMDKAVFDISEMTGKLAFGFDSEADYGTGSFVMGLSSSSSSPYARVIYWSKTSITSATDYFSISGNVAILDLDALKATYTTAVLLFVNVPHSVWLLENRVDIRKSLAWLTVSGYVPSIVVASDGSGDYTTISAAVSAAHNGDTIYIKDGEYKETVIVNKYIHLVGQSKQGTILYNDAGDYDNAPLLITQGSVCNMTIKSLAPADTSGLTDYAYAIHLDKHFATLAKYQKCEIYNCDIYSEVNDAIGAGTNYATEYDVHDCFLHVAHNPVKTGACGFKCHNGTNQTTGKVRLRNNIIITEDANGTSCYDILFHNGGISNIQPIELIQVGNVLKYYANGITSIFVPSGYNYGNSVAAMNTLS